MDAYFDQSRLTIYTKHKTPCAWGIEPPLPKGFGMNCLLITPVYAHLSLNFP